MTNEALSRQVGGNHYKDTAIQPLEFIVANGLGFCEGNIVKYTTRFLSKGGIEDLQKIEHYIQLHVETVGMEPWLIRQMRIWLATEVAPPMHPEEYFEANSIENKHQKHLIAGVCYWRAGGQTQYGEQSMLNAARALMAEHMTYGGTLDGN